MAINSTTGIDTKSLLPATTSTNAVADTSNVSDATSTASDKLAQAQKAALSSPTGTKAQLNISILQASLEVSLNSTNDPLSLVYKSAIENINDVLRPQLGDQAIQNAMSQDNSPEGTAGRIVSFISNMFEMFKQNNPDKDDSTNVDDYMNLIFKGVDAGFKEARGILDSLGALNGDIADNIDKTYDLVQKSLSDFVNKIKGGGQDDGSSSSGGTVVASETSVSISISVSQTRISTTA